MVQSLSLVLRPGREGSLDRVVGLLRRRCVPVRAITFGTAEPGGSLALRLMLGACDHQTTDEAVQHLLKLADVISVTRTAG